MQPIYPCEPHHTWRRCDISHFVCWLRATTQPTYDDANEHVERIASLSWRLLLLLRPLHQSIYIGYAHGTAEHALVKWHTYTHHPIQNKCYSMRRRRQQRIWWCPISFRRLRCTMCEKTTLALHQKHTHTHTQPQQPRPHIIFYSMKITQFPIEKAWKRPKSECVCIGWRARSWKEKNMYPKGVIYTNRANISASSSIVCMNLIGQSEEKRKLWSGESASEDMGCHVAVVQCPFRECIDGNEIIFSFFFSFSFFSRCGIGHAFQFSS